MSGETLGKRTVESLRQMKQQGQKITMLTAYDYPTARILNRSGIDMILVGDSLGMVLLGYSSTQEVTMDDMLRHTAAVARGNTCCFLVGDMPYLSYESPKQALENAQRFLSVGADAVKLEGNYKEIVQHLVGHQVPVMGHIGLTPQTATNFKVRGRTEAAARQLLCEAAELQDAGCFSLVIESVPRKLGAQITQQLDIPTIGIGAGPDCDGQVLVWHDVVGIFEEFTPRFVKRYALLAPEMEKAARAYVEDVRGGIFPGDEHCYN